MTAWRTKTGRAAIATIALGVLSCLLSDDGTIRSLGDIFLAARGVPGAEILIGLVTFFGREAIAKLQDTIKTALGR